MAVTYHFIIFHVVPRPCGTVLTVGQTEAQSDVVLAVELLVLGDTHDEVGEAELAHGVVCRGDNYVLPPCCLTLY